MNYAQALAHRDECAELVREHNAIVRADIGMELMEWVRINRALMIRRNAANDALARLMKAGDFDPEDIA